MINQPYLFFLFALFTFNSVNSQTDESDVFNYDIKYFYNQKDVIIKEDISILNFKELPKNKHFGINNGAYLFKVEIKNHNLKNQKYIVQIPTHNIGNVQLYEGDHYKIDFRKAHKPSVQINKRFPTFLIESKGNTIFYLKTVFHKDTNFPIKIETEQAYYLNSISKINWSGMYYGLLIAVIIFNLFFYYKFQDELYLYYVFFLVAYNFASLYYDGFFREYLNYNLEVVVHLSMAITMFLFSFKFLNLNNYFPKFKYVAIALISIIGIFTISYLFTNNFILFALVDTIDMFCFLLVWIISFSIIKKAKYAIFYILGYFILIGCGYFLILSYNFGLYAVSADSNFLKIAGAIDMLIFTYAIIYRMDILTKENLAIIKDLKSFIDNYPTDQKNATSSIDPLFILLKENELSNQVLTLREIEVLKCIYEGKSNPEIADDLFVSTNTVKYHTRNIYKKLEVSNRKETSEKISFILEGTN